VTALAKRARAARALAFPRQHRYLNTLPGYWIRGGGTHHLDGKHYLRRGLSGRQRVQYLIDHYALEAAHWDRAYHRAVYGGSGVDLWRHDNISINLQGSSEFRGSLHEGELKLALWVDDLPLHQMNLSMLVDPGLGAIPFVGRSQGCSNWHPEARAVFDKAFPQNAAMFFCFAAVKGVARAIGARGVIGVRGSEQVSATRSEAERFHRNYDMFWRNLGGHDDSMGFFIPLDGKADNDSGHRRRARQRRANWAAIEASTVDALDAHTRQSDLVDA
jgi:uncharacterized protein VirK/YbjX